MKLKMTIMNVGWLILGLYIDDVSFVEVMLRGKICWGDHKNARIWKSDSWPVWGHSPGETKGIYEKPHSEQLATLLRFEPGTYQIHVSYFTSIPTCSLTSVSQQCQRHTTIFCSFALPNSYFLVFHILQMITDIL